MPATTTALCARTATGRPNHHKATQGTSITLASLPPHLIADLLAQDLALVQRDAPCQLHGQDPPGGELIHYLRHFEEGVALQQLPGERGQAGGLAGGGARAAARGGGMASNL